MRAVAVQPPLGEASFLAPAAGEAARRRTLARDRLRRGGVVEEELLVRPLGDLAKQRERGRGEVARPWEREEAVRREDRARRREVVDEALAVAPEVKDLVGLGVVDVPEREARWGWLVSSSSGGGVVV